MRGLATWLGSGLGLRLGLGLGLGLELGLGLGLGLKSSERRTHSSTTCSNCTTHRVRGVVRAVGVQVAAAARAQFHVVDVAGRHRGGAQRDAVAAAE